MTLTVLVCARSELMAGTVRAVTLPRDPHGRPREALVLLGHDGEPRAYLNLCRHLPVPLDGGSRQYLTRDGEHLFCGTHGAMFRRDDGLCVQGPCKNLALFALSLVETDGVLSLLLPDAQEPR